MVRAGVGPGLDKAAWDPETVKCWVEERDSASVFTRAVTDGG